MGYQMTRTEAKEYINSNARQYLRPDRSGKGFLCVNPNCTSGSGHNGTGMTTKDGRHFSCWSCGISSADMIDLIGIEYGIEDYNGKLKKACELFNIELIPDPAYQNQYQNQAKNGQYQQPNIHNTAYTSRPTQQLQTPEPDYTDFFLQAHCHINETDYHRGLSQKTIDDFKLGFVPEWRHPKSVNAPTSPRLIIPTSKHSYLARDIRANLTEEQMKYSKQKVGAVRIFNWDALYKATAPVIVVEGEIDALSIIDVGGQAIGLGSTSNKKKLLNMLRDSRPIQPLILSLDNDSAGSQANKELADGLTELKIPFVQIDIAKPYKDANEALMKDREALRIAVESAIREAENIGAEALEAEKELLKQEAVLYSLQDFLQNIEASKRAEYVPTGFKNIDNLLDGGLYAGLYIIGAISSLGKTTFALQIADQVACNGSDVLIFSLEMARNELIAKSVSRLTVIQDMEQNGTTKNAKTTRGILTGSRYKYYSQDERELIQNAVVSYGQYAGNIYITEGMGNVGVNEIREKIEKHVKLTGKAPVVVIDYLQIIAPADIRATDKQNTDKAVLELKRISRDFSIPVIGISSFNRDNYTAPVNLTSFKESGAIEYSSDVLIGLQYEGMDYMDKESEKEREKRIRTMMREAVTKAKNGEAQQIQVKVLKNRNGSKGYTVLDFYPMFNYFVEQENRNGAKTNGTWTNETSSYRK